MSVSNRDKKILIVFLGILIFGLVYFFPVRGYMDDTDKLKAENVSLQPKLTDLQEKVAKETELKTETATLRAKTTTIVSKFPSFLQTENEIMNMVKLEKELKIEIPTITVNAPVEVQTSEPVEEITEVVQPEGSEEDSTDASTANPLIEILPKYRLYCLSTDITYNGGYKSMKEFLDKISKSSDKKSINTVALSFDEKTGNLDGNIVYDSYYLEGSDRPYEEIITKTLKHGTKNIFGTVDASKIKTKKSK